VFNTNKCYYECPTGFFNTTLDETEDETEGCGTCDSTCTECYWNSDQDCTACKAGEVVFSNEFLDYIEQGGDWRDLLPELYPERSGLPADFDSSLRKGRLSQNKNVIATLIPTLTILQDLTKDGVPSVLRTVMNVVKEFVHIVLMDT